MEKLHCSTPLVFNQVTTGITIPNISDRGVIRAIRLYRIGSHASAVVKFKLLSHPAAAGLTGPINDPNNAIAGGAPDLFLVAPEVSVGASAANSIQLGLDLPYVNRAIAPNGNPNRALYLLVDTSAPAQQWYISLDIVEGAL